MRAPTTELFSSVRRDHLRIVLPRPQTGSMNAGIAIAMMPSVASMWFTIANQMMKATATKISNGARQSSASIVWMIDCMTCGSPVARVIS